MKKTRNLFVLIGKSENVEIALNFLQFKGTTILTNENVNDKSINDVFSNNRSVITNCVDYSLRKDAIVIEIINGSILSNKLLPHIDISSDDIISQFKKIAERYNCDIGDHKSNSSGLNGIPTKEDCAYCNHIKNNMDNRCIYSSKYFFVMPTLGEFIKGYLLIIPYRHVMSMAELNTFELYNLIEVLNDIKFILKNTYHCSNLLVWENGTGNGGIGKAKDSVVHAHLHVAPSNLDANSIEKISGFDFTEIKTDDLLDYGQHSYLLLQQDNNIWKINNNSNLYIPRQYVRQILAEEYGIPGEQWNWREYPYRELMNETNCDISKYIHSNWYNLRQRIRDNTIKFVIFN